ncbi:hypothetical protein BDZ94DRAFT_855128 [Collybia nuda]|uniref:F-box domain-containing protein n=1 Tax=Collybia nuda TaxID=64659 RepID=A0A9P5Y4S0_9AGAR|nr:hypothetical protein BDZ94DRAFT_855128 [Collybia nuda]
MSSQTLPQELIDNVIDHFHDDRPSLKACALVCRAWLSSCRAHIFHSISLQPPTVNLRSQIFGTTTDSWRLHKILQTSPEIAQYIRNLLICEGIVGKEWINGDRTLPLLLGKLRNITKFQLERSSSMRIIWKTIPPGLRGAMISVLGSPSLLELKLVGLVFDRPAELLQILQSCRILRVLRADHLIFQDEQSLDFSSVVQSDRPSAPLDILVVGPRTSTALIRCLLHPESTINAKAVRKLSLSISGNFPDVAQLLRSTSSVEELELILMNDIDLQEYWALPSSDHIDLSHNPHLHTLEIKFDVIQRQDDPLPWLNAVLFTVRTPNALRYINIVYSLYLPSPYMDRSVNTTIFTGWRDIDVTLTGMDFVHLEKVKLHFALENPIGFGIAPRFLKEVDLKSPALLAAGLLEIGAFDTSE